MPTITTDHLTIACDLYGSEDAPAVLLLHGWPDDATSWDRVAPRLAQAGLRVVVPTLRGFGATRFRYDHTPRTGDSAILALDAIALMDALGIDRFMVAGHDWGSNIAEALAVGWPERVRKLAMLATPPRLGACRPRPSIRRSGNGITGSWRPDAAHRPSATTGAALPISTGSTGRRRAGSTRRPSTRSPSPSTIPTGRR